MAAFIHETANVIDCDLADSSKVWQNVFLKKCQLGCNVNIGDFTRAENSRFDDMVNVQRNSLIYSSEIGKYTYSGKNLTMWHAKVGAFCSISWNVGIGGANHDYSRTTTHAFLYSPYMNLGADDEHGYDRFTEPCEIGNDVWIGANAIICRNVRIGDGAVIGAGAVITKNVEPYSIVAGVPGKEIKKRFNDDVIERLLKIKWWEFDEETIRNNYDCMNSVLNNEVLDKLEKIRMTIK